MQLPTMEVSSRPSLGDLLDRLLSAQLIDACHMTADYVTVVQGAKRHSVAHRKARTFLMSLLRGRSWQDEEPGTAQPDGAHLRSIEKRDVPSGPDPVQVEQALSDLLHLAAEMKVIQHFERDKRAKTVTIRLDACTSDMTEAEAIAYLADCIRHGLRTDYAEEMEARRPGHWTTREVAQKQVAGSTVD